MKHQGVYMFDLNKLKFDSTPEVTFEPPATDEMIEELENYYQHRLPDELKQIFKKYHGGCPDAYFLEVYFPDEELPSEMEVSNFLILDSLINDTLNIWFSIKHFGHYMGEHSVPFAMDFAGHIYYLKYKDNNHQVWYLAHQESEEVETFLVSNSFELFLNSLFCE